jgi:hypothetical protein
MHENAYQLFAVYVNSLDMVQTRATERAVGFKGIFIAFFASPCCRRWIKHDIYRVHKSIQSNVASQSSYLWKIE